MSTIQYRLILLSSSILYILFILSKSIFFIGISNASTKCHAR
jgi:hypothetical protein